MHAGVSSAITNLTPGTGDDLANGGPGTDLAAVDCETLVAIP